jgi:hypothetical protein
MALPTFNPVKATVSDDAPRVSLEVLLEAPEYSREALQANDLRKLSAPQRSATIAYLCARYKLPQDDGLITVINTKDGSVKPYVTAPGVFFLSRDKVKSLRVKIEESASGYIVCKATATTNDGREFEAYGAKRSVGDFDMALMKADTAARVRACKVAVGLSLMTYAEAVTLDETAEIEVKPNE